MSEFSVHTFTAFLCLVRDGLVSAGGGCSSPWIWDSGILMPLQSCVWETLKKIGNMEILHDSCLYFSFEYMADCLRLGVNWPWSTSSWSPFYFRMCEVTDVPGRKTFLTSRRKVDEQLICKSIIPALPALFVSGDCTQFPTIHTLVRSWRSA